MDAVGYLDNVVSEFARLRKLADAATAQISAEALLRAPSPESNSIAVIMKHMAGNMRSRWTDFLNSDGEKPDRNRDAEFELTEQDTAACLAESWTEGWRVLFDALSALSPEDLDRNVYIRGERFSVVQAINRQLTHYGLHVGQIVYVARLFAGPSWRSLSIPRGESRQFNEEPRRYF